MRKLALHPEGRWRQLAEIALTPARAPLEPAPDYAGEGTETDMETSEYIAALLGPVLIATSLSMLINRGHFERIATEISTSPALIYIAGISALVIGLAIVQAHNVWVWDWPVITTIFGWLAIVGGLLRILAPDRVAEMARSMVENKVPISAAAIIGLPIGCLLTAFGFGFMT